MVKRYPNATMFDTLRKFMTNDNGIISGGWVDLAQPRFVVVST